VSEPREANSMVRRCSKASKGSASKGKWVTVAREINMAFAPIDTFTLLENDLETCPASHKTSKLQEIYSATRSYLK